MKSIATELVNEYIDNRRCLEIWHYEKFKTFDKLIKETSNNITSVGKFWFLEEFNILQKAKQHTLTCQTILDNNRKFGIMGKELMNIIKWCESEIKILKDGGLI